MTLPEDEDEEHEQHAESGHVVHCLHQDHQLSPQSWHEPYQLQHPQQPESPQYRQTTIRLPNNLAYTERKNTTSKPGKNKVLWWHRAVNLQTGTI